MRFLPCGAETRIMHVELRPDGLISASSPPKLPGSARAAAWVCLPLAQEPLGTLSWHPGMLLDLAQGLWRFHWAPASVLLWEEENGAGVSHNQQVHELCESQSMSSSKVLVAMMCSFCD